jgi:hypothetical protein
LHVETRPFVFFVYFVPSFVVFVVQIMRVVNTHDIGKGKKEGIAG